MRAASRLSLLILLFSIACSRSGDEVAAPSPSAVPKAPSLTAADAAPSPTIGTPEPSPSADVAEEDDDFDGADEGQFQCAVHVSQYFGPIPMTVEIHARARNGTPPYTFTWDFGDGTPSATGESVTHTYSTLGRIDTFMHGRDAAGETYTIQIILFVTTPEEYARQKDLPTPTPATPAPSGPLPPPPSPLR